MKVFHGSAIDLPEDIDELEDEIIFDNLETGYSDLYTIWFSENEDTGKRFANSQAKHSVSNGLPILLELELELDEDKVLYHDRNDTFVELDEAEYDPKNDREELYDHMQRLGYQAHITEDNYAHEEGYGTGANDIAVFDESLYTTKSARLFIGDKWSAPIKDEEMLIKVIKKAFYEKELDNKDDLSFD